MADHEHDLPDGPSDDGTADVPGNRPAHMWSALRHPAAPEDVDGLTPLAQQLQSVPSGSELAALVLSLDLDTLDAYDRVEVVAAAGRVESWAHAIKAQAAAAVDRHPKMRAPVLKPPTGRALTHQHISTATLAMRLHASP